jgi:hypothetical protein
VTHARARRFLGHTGQVLACVLAAALVSLPLALERGLERTRIHADVGLVPATLTLTGTSDSRLRLGILGSIRVPASKGPLGLSVTADGAPRTPDESAGISSYFSPAMLKVYGGLFHDPEAAIRGYVTQLEHDFRDRTLAAWALYTTVGTLLLLLGLAIMDPALRMWLHRHRTRALAAGTAAGLVLSTAVAALEFREWAGSGDHGEDFDYALPALDGTRAEGAVTDSPVLRLAIQDAIPKVQQLVDRQQARTDGFVASATSQLEAARDAMTGPREGEVAVMMQSDMHCNSAMIALQRRVVELLDQQYGAGTVSLLAISGDLTTNGTAAEGGCIEDEAAIAGDAPVVAVAGNHESEVSVRQMAGAGMKVLDGSTAELSGTTVLGAGDPERTEMFGATRLRGEATQQSTGEALYETALEDRPEITLVHEGYAAAAFIGDVPDMPAFLDARGSDTAWWDDGVRDLPTGSLFYGHWHREVLPRVVWNSDGTWTLVMELNTSGGAIDAPTLNHFSTPWSKPQQRASFAVVFKNSDSGLVTGYQRYAFATDGTVTVQPRVEIGTPGGRPTALTAYGARLSSPAARPGPPAG